MITIKCVICGCTEHAPKDIAKYVCKKCYEIELARQEDDDLKQYWGNWK